MGLTDRVWGALTAMVKLEDKVSRQSEALKTQQARIEQIVERVIRLEAQMEMLISAATIRNLKAGRSAGRGGRVPRLADPSAGTPEDKDR